MRSLSEPWATSYPEIPIDLCVVKVSWDAVLHQYMYHWDRGRQCDGSLERVAPLLRDIWKAVCSRVQHRGQACRVQVRCANLLVPEVIRVEVVSTGKSWDDDSVVSPA
ncbi:hypothetical protein DOTSEDRAFT_75157 [Dothistroma septosporum NZE10]|uniref:Uncharacterized protein n=1 Tax=Dothistroma septosporum (strain NZE10 / CBS 128990) TaxID=675120 RepID=M2YKH0_DOTSN|nr:hypothetical protein DOTSEDRAFT_75157 [Dothistroma septosporum NZE10]